MQPILFNTEMPDREKLIQLLVNDDCPLLYVLGENIGTLVDYMIAKGVTVQKTNSQMQEEAREREAVIVDLRKKWQAAETLICTMCGHCEYEEVGRVLCMKTDCGEICGYPCCGKFTPRERWIPVTERLPEKNSDGTHNAVLVTDGRVQHMAYFINGDWLFAESGEAKEIMFYTVTHWMPLPEEPK